MKPIETVCIVGAGYMGWQIGLQCAVHGHSVCLMSRTMGTLERASQSQAQELDRWIAARRITAADKEAILHRIHFTTDMREAVSGADLVIESVPEVLETKREVFGQLDRICSSPTILATNSSSIRISKIEDATHRPDKVLNMHFYHRPWDRPLVELMRGTETSGQTMNRARIFARRSGLTPLLVRKESTGFILNRVWRAIKKECLHLVDEGIASYEDVDRAWMLAFELPIGPFGRMDIIGLDVVRDIEMVYYRESGDPSDAPPEFLLAKIERGDLGVKAGKGFYTYPNPAFRNPSWLRGDAE